MWVIIDWTDTNVIGVFNSKEYAEHWLKGYWLKAGQEWPGIDKTECSIHKITNTDEADIRVFA